MCVWGQHRFVCDFAGRLDRNGKPLSHPDCLGEFIRVMMIVEKCSTLGEPGHVVTGVRTVGKYHGLCQACWLSEHSRAVTVRPWDCFDDVEWLNETLTYRENFKINGSRLDGGGIEIRSCERYDTYGEIWTKGDPEPVMYAGEHWGKIGFTGMD